MTAVNRKRILKFGSPFLAVLVTGIGHPTVRLHQHSRSQIFVTVPPVGWAGSGTASAKDTLVEAVELLSIFDALEVFGVGRWSSFLF